MDEVKQLQTAIKFRLAEMGMSQAELAEKIFVEDHDEDDELALEYFIGALKKQLNRASTSPEKLRRYLEILLMDRRGLEGALPLDSIISLTEAGTRESASAFSRN